MQFAPPLHHPSNIFAYKCVFTGDGQMTSLILLITTDLPLATGLSSPVFYYDQAPDVENKILTAQNGKSGCIQSGLDCLDWLRRGWLLRTP